ncbi:MAG: hypothetical protein GY810_28950 [Aureispira sp.]|nr:hypothetical protein [Aureispira sp.]
MAVFLLSIPVLFLLGGLILLIVGLIIQIPLVWIIGLILLGVLVLGLIIFFISLSTSLSNSNME